MITNQEAALIMSLVTLVVNSILVIVSSKAASDSRKRASQVNSKALIASKIGVVQSHINTARECLLNLRSSEDPDLEEAKSVCAGIGQELRDESGFCGSRADMLEETAGMLLDTGVVATKAGIVRFMFQSALVKDDLLQYSRELVE